VSEGRTGRALRKGGKSSLHNVIDSMEENGISDLLPLGQTESREEEILVLSNDGEDGVLERIDSTGG